MRFLGLLIIGVALAIPAYSFIQMAQARDTIALFSQYLGVSALVMMSFAQILATRAPGLETLFGGLDRIYVLHKWLGISAMALILLHDTIDAEMRGLGPETLISEVAETLGEISLYGLLILVTISVATFVPYHLWRYTHKLMGAFFAAGALHFLFISKPFSIADPLGLYVGTFCAAGLLAYLFTLLPLAGLKGWRRYSVASVVATGGALAVALVPAGRGFRHRPGQFAFLQFDVPGTTEVHPFTISQAPRADRALRFTIKALGDYTGQLGAVVKPGVTARVSGPFGRFRAPKTGPQVWIAAGAGITPFLAWAQALDPHAGPVNLFWSVRNRAEAPHLDELEALAAGKENLILHVQETDRVGRLHARQIADAATGDKRLTRIAFCGPTAMREDLARDLPAVGLGRPLDYEEFEIRSGIGLGRLSAWLFERIAAHAAGKRRPVA